jgi:hypothetical protein
MKKKEFVMRMRDRKKINHEKKSMMLIDGISREGLISSLF